MEVFFIIDYYNYLNEEDKKSVDKMKNCEHLFVKFVEGEDINLGHSSDCYYDPPIIQCVHCGLTNKYIREVESDEKYGLNKLLVKVVINSEFRKQFKDIWKSDRYFNDEAVNYISKGVLGGNPMYWNAVELYNSAKELAGEDADNDLIFDIMKQIRTGKIKLEKGPQKVKE